ncbi:MAG: metallophosphoesterase, partial [Clostridium sp.]|nr:metallophosphoesterase [Clostridium sp.]
TQASLSEEQLSWFKEKLKEEYTPGKPIFVFLHQAIFTDFFGQDWHGVRQGDEFTDILKDYPEVIIFSSHDHKDFGDDSIHENMPYTMAYTGAVGYTLFRDEDNDGELKGNYSYNNALYVEVKDNVVTLNQRDVKDHKWINSKEISK